MGSRRRWLSGPSWGRSVSRARRTLLVYPGARIVRYPAPAFPNEGTRGQTVLFPLVLLWCGLAFRVDQDCLIPVRVVVEVRDAGERISYSDSPVPGVELKVRDVAFGDSLSSTATTLEALGSRLIANQGLSPSARPLCPRLKGVLDGHICHDSSQDQLRDYLFFFSLFNLRFSFGSSWAFFCCCLLPLSFFPLSPISLSPCLKMT